MGSRLCRNAGSSAFLLEGTMLKSDKITCAYSVVNCVKLRTFWMPLVCQVRSWSPQPFRCNGKYIKWCCFQWPWLTPNIDFKVMILFSINYHWKMVEDRAMLTTADLQVVIYHLSNGAIVSDWLTINPNVKGALLFDIETIRDFSCTPAHFRRSCFRHCGPNSLEFSAWQFPWSSCWAWSVSTWLENASVWVTLRLV